VALAACGGSDDPPQLSGGSSNSSLSGGLPPTAVDNPEAESYFVDTFYPTLQTPCAQCHATGQFGAPNFMAAGDPKQAYQIFKTYRNGSLSAPAAINLLLNKGWHEGFEMVAAQVQAAKSWLRIEHPGDDTQEGPDLYDTLKNYANCMDIEEWTLQGIDQFFAIPTADNACTCETCHINQAITAGFHLSADVNKTFSLAKIFPGVLKFVTPVPSVTGAFAGVQQANRIVEKGREFDSCTCDDGKLFINNPNDPNYCHPNYTLADVEEKGLNTFVDSTISLSVKQVCTPQTMEP
jgi:mono/diheme cytochrome c family protein